MDLREVLDRPVFAAGDLDYRRADVVAAARQWSRWAELERRTADGLAALGRLPEKIGQTEEMEAWLEHWGLRAHDWSGYLHRGIARTRATGEGGLPPVRARPARLF